MVIYGINGKKLLDAILTESAEHEEELGKTNLVRLSWNSDIKMAIHAGSYIIPFGDGLKYRLLDSYAPSESDNGFKYNPEFHHPLMLLGRIPFLYATKDAGGNDIKQQEWSFDGLTVTALEYCCKAINEAFGITDDTQKFTYTLCGTVDGSVSFSVSSSDILSVLSSIAQACKDNTCEWHLSWEHRCLYFGQISINLGEEIPVLKVHDNLQTASVSESKENYYNCFYPQGSTKNMSRKAQVGTGNVATLARLGLNTSVYPDGCIYIGQDGNVITKAQFDASNAIKQTLALSFDDIFPHLDLYAYNIRKRVRWLKNDTTGEWELDSLGNKKTYTVWYMRLAYCTRELVSGKTPVNTTQDKDEQGNNVTHYWYDYVLDKNHQILQGYKLKGSFKVNTHTTNNQYDALTQSLVGQPNGQDGFELDYHDEDSHSLPTIPATGDSGVSILKGDYEIVMYQSGDTIIPTNEDEGLIPHGNSLPDLTCNVVVLFNIVMGEHETKLAQEELAARTVKEINRRVQDKNNYTAPSNAVAFAKKNPNLFVGQKVTFDDGFGYQLHTRVIKLVTKLDYPIIQEITVGNQAVKGTITQLKEDVNSILSGNFSGGGGLNLSQISNIIRNYVDSRFLRKDIPDIAQGLITFLKGIVIGNDSGIDEKGVATLSKVLADTITSKAFVKGQGGKGFGAYLDNLKKSHIESDYLLTRIKAIMAEAVIDILTAKDITCEKLTVTKQAHFFKLIIDEIKAAGGQVVLSYADCTAERVVKQTNGNYRVYWTCKNEKTGKAILNKWQVNDQALCQTFNAAEGVSYNVSNKYYWRLVVSAGRQTLDDTEYNYIELSNTVKDGSSVPEANDEIAGLGYRGADDEARQGAIILSAYASPDRNVKAPSIVQYKGIKSFSLDGCIMNQFSANGNIIRGNLQVESGKTIETVISEGVASLSIGGRNMLRNSNVPVTSASYQLAEFELASIPTEGETYTISIKGELGSDRSYFAIFNSGWRVHLRNLSNANLKNGVYSGTFTWTNTNGTDTVVPTYLKIFNFPSTSTSSSKIEWIKLEAGNKATDWSPAPEDIETKLTTIETKFEIREGIISTKVTQATQAATSAQSSASVASSSATTAGNKANAASASATAAGNSATSASASANTAGDKANAANASAIAAGKSATNAKGSADSAKGSADAAKSSEDKAKNSADAAAAKLVLITQKETSINQTADAINLKASQVEESVTTAQMAAILASAMSKGKMLYRDPTFAKGMNGLSAYWTNPITREKGIANNPNGSEAYSLKIDFLASGGNNKGGFRFTTQTRANAIFVCRFIGIFPSHATLVFGTNATGDNGSKYWLTPNKGTGKYEEYAYYVRCGDSGEFSTTNFFYISSDVTTAFSGRLCYATVFDLTDTDDLPTRTEMTAQFDVLATSINSKVSKAEYDGNNNIINQRFSTLEQTDEGISTRVTSVENGVQTAQSTATSAQSAATAAQASATSAQSAAQSASTAAAAAQASVDNMEIGGRNLILNSANVITSNSSVSLSKSAEELKGKEVMLSFEYECINVSTGANDNQRRFGLEEPFKTSGSTTYRSCFVYLPASQTGINKKGRASNSFTIPENLTQNTSSFHAYIQVTGGTVKMWNFKLEEGNKATSWTPAPEDLNSYADTKAEEAKNAALADAAAKYTLKTVYESQIQQLSNEISLKVSSATFNALGQRVTASECKIEILEGKVALTVTNAELQEALGLVNQEGRNYYALSSTSSSTGNFIRRTFKLEKNTAYTVRTTVPRPGSNVMDVWAAAGQTIAEDSSKNGVAPDAPRIVTTDKNGYITVSFRRMHEGKVNNGEYKIWVAKGDAAWRPAIEDQDYFAQLYAGASQANAIAEAQEMYDKIKVGGRNILRSSNDGVNNSVQYLLKRYNLAFAPSAGQTYTISIKGNLGSDRKSFGIYNSGGSVELIRLTPEMKSNGVYTGTFEWTNKNADGSVTVTPTYINIYQFQNSGTSASTIEWIKLEAGNKATDWSIAYEDVSAQILNLGNEIALMVPYTVYDGDVARIKTCGIDIKAGKITMVGDITANGNVHINSDGTIKAVNGEFTGLLRSPFEEYASLSEWANGKSANWYLTAASAINGTTFNLTSQKYNGAVIKIYNACVVDVYFFVPSVAGGGQRKYVLPQHKMIIMVGVPRIDNPSFIGMYVITPYIYDNANNRYVIQ